MSAAMLRLTQAGSLHRAASLALHPKPSPLAPSLAMINQYPRVTFEGATLGWWDYSIQSLVGTPYTGPDTIAFFLIGRPPLPLGRPPDVTLRLMPLLQGLPFWNHQPEPTLWPTFSSHLLPPYLGTPRCFHRMVSPADSVSAVPGPPGLADPLMTPDDYLSAVVDLILGNPDD